MSCLISDFVSPVRPKKCNLNSTGPHLRFHWQPRVATVTHSLSVALLTHYFHINMSHDMTKPTKWVCTQQRLRSAWASAQSDQSSLCAKWVAKDPRFLHADSEDCLRCPHEETLGGCPGWSESLLGAQSFCWLCHEAAHNSSLLLLLIPLVSL